MKAIRNIPVKSSMHKKPIVTDIFFIKNNVRKPLIIFCHGYKGYKDWGAWNLVARFFAKKGLFFVKFNFSHNGGTLENPIDFPDLEAFGQNNYIRELDDLDDIIKWITTHEEYASEIDRGDITLIGHSRGGGIACLKAAENKLVKRVISWAGTSDFEARMPSGKELSDWEKAGVAYVMNARTNQNMPLYYQFYQSFKDNIERLTVKNAVEKLKIPQLIIQGEGDVVVQPDEARNLHKWNPKSKLVLIEDMNHTLGSAQPWEKSTMPTHLKSVVDETIRFINTN